MKRYICVLILITNLFDAYPQTPERPQTHQVSELVRRVEIPVNYSSGMVDISIPIYEIVVGDAKIPITLSYNHKGIRESETPHKLGIGWTLNAEPQLSRIINGLSDKDTKYNSADDKSIDRKGTEYYLNLAKNVLDEDPDQYFYSIPNKNGSFYFKRNPQSGKFEAVTIPYEPIKIDYWGNDKFVINDDNGNLYKFGGKDYKEEETPGGNTTAWKCTEIEIPSKKATIQFEYYKNNIDFGKFTTNCRLEVHDGPYQGRDLLLVDYYNINAYGQPGPPKITLQNFPDPIKLTRHVPKVLTTNPSYTECSFLARVRNTPDGNNYSWKFIMATNQLPTGKDHYKGHLTQSIKMITFPGGRIEFKKSSSGGLYSEIIIYDKNENIIKKVLLNHHSKYTDPLLNSVIILNRDLKEEFKYNIMYNRMWGAISGSSVNYNFAGYRIGDMIYSDFGRIQRTYLPIESGINHDELPRNMYIEVGNTSRFAPTSKEGVIRSITTSLGDSTVYEFESDKYKVQMEERGRYETKVLEDGGLRIKKTIQYDHNTQKKLTRIFKYGDQNGREEDGLGHPKFERIGMANYTQSYRLTYLNSNNGSIDYSYRVRVLSPWLFGDMTFAGNPVTYTRVSEYIIEEKNNEIVNNGKIVYTYNYSRTDVSIVPGSNVVHDSKTYLWTKGKLIGKEVFKREGTLYIPIEKTSYKYTLFQKEKIPVGKAYRNTIAISGGSYMSYVTETEARDVIYTQYSIMTGAQRLQTVTNKKYIDNAQTVTSTTEYTYGNLDHLYPTEIKITNSDGRTRSTKISYPLDQGTLGTKDHLDAKKKMIEKWAISSELEKIEYNTSGSIAALNHYYIFSGLALPLLKKTSTKKDNLLEEVRLTFHNYDQYSNPVYITKDNATNIVYLWSYNGQYLIAEIENATYCEVVAALQKQSKTIEGLSAMIIPTWDVTKFRTDLPNALITTYTYKPLVGMLTATGPSGRTTSYEYDSFNRLYRIKDHEGKIVEEYKYNYSNK